MYGQSVGSVSHHSTIKPQMPILCCWILSINYFTLQPLSTELLMPLTLSLSHFLSKFFFTFLHLNLKPRCPNTCRIVSESLRDSLFVDNGPWQPVWRSFWPPEHLATAFSQVDDSRWSDQGKVVEETWRLLDNNSEIQDVRLTQSVQKLVFFFSRNEYIC